VDFAGPDISRSRRDVRLAAQERPFPLDLVPRIIDATNGRRSPPAVAQRVRALEAFLADVYGDSGYVRTGVIPRISSSPRNIFHRAAADSSRPTGCASTSPAPTSFATSMASAAYWRIMYVRLLVSVMCWKIAGGHPGFPRRSAAHRVRPVSTIRNAARGAASAALAASPTRRGGAHSWIYNSAYASFPAR